MEEDIKKLDIKDFPSLSAAPETCNILLVQQAGSPGKITIGLFKTMVKRDLTPSIKDGMWYIGETDTDVQAEGKSPVFRKGSTGVEWKYDTEENDVWRQLVDYSAITLTFDDLTPEEKDSLKMKLERLTPEEIAELQKPASEMITALEATNKNATDKEAERYVRIMKQHVPVLNLGVLLLKAKELPPKGHVPLPKLLVPLLRIQEYRMKMPARLLKQLVQQKKAKELPLKRHVPRLRQHAHLLKRIVYQKKIKEKPPKLHEYLLRQSELHPKRNESKMKKHEKLLKQLVFQMKQNDQLLKQHVIMQK